MIEWAAPWALALLAPIALLPWQPRWTGVARVRLPGPDVHVEQPTWTLRRLAAPAPLVLQMIGLALVVVALARPRLTHKSTRVESDGLDIMLAVDTSGSMRAEDFAVGGQAVDRLSVAKGVIKQFVDERPHDRLGIVVFGEEAFTHVPLTLDHDTLQRVLEAIQIGIAGESRTAIGQAIAVAARRMKELEAPERVVILLTDGQSNAGRFSPTEAADLAAQLGIKVYTIGIGAQQARGGLFGFMRGGDGIDEATLRAVAERTGARYFRATDTRTLRQIYETINELEPSPAEVEEQVHHEELFRWPLVPGVLALLLQQLLAATWLRRWP
ncbi:MAG TPA: VWA domain-containing protein [Myxococcota bacterium]|nr:VWA domain-containing protein [Myxococcota bacterium]